MLKEGATLGEILPEYLKRKEQDMGNFNNSTCGAYHDYLTLHADKVAALAKYIVSKTAGSNPNGKIEAIKDFRQITGLDLRTSKDMIELFLPEYNHTEKVAELLRNRA